MDVTGNTVHYNLSIDLSQKNYLIKSIKVQWTKYGNIHNIMYTNEQEVKVCRSAIQK